MSSTCLTPDAIKDIQDTLAKDNISMQTLSNMDTKTRTDYFAKILGADLGMRVNEKFEQNMLKKQKDSLTKWLNKQSQLSEPRRKDLMKKIEHMDKIIVPKNSKPFLADLAKKKLGFSISHEDASILLDASRKLIEKREAFLKKYPEYSNFYIKDRAEFMKDDSKLRDAQEIGALNLGYQIIYELIRLKYTDPSVKAAFQEGTKEGVVALAKLVPSILKSLNASIDLSAPRQLTKAFFFDPASIFKAEWAGLKTIIESLKGNKQLSGLIELYSRPNFINGNYLHFGVDVGIQEEAFPTSILQKIPGLGALFRASEETFNVAIQHARANLFDVLWDKSGHSNYLMSGAGELINVLTGRGTIVTPKDPEWAKWQNILLFSPRLLSSNIEIFTNVITKMPSMMRWGNATKQGDWIKHKQFMASIQFFLGEAIIAILANALLGDDESDDGVEFDPRSSDFMKIRAGNTTYDITGGAAAVAVLFARAATLNVKSGQGKIQNVQGAGQLVEQFLSGKFSPLVRTAIDANDTIGWGDGKDFAGEPMSIQKFFTNRAPISIQNAFDEGYKNDKDRVVATFADFFGIGTTTYERSNSRFYTQDTPTRRITSNAKWNDIDLETKQKVEKEFRQIYESRAKAWLDNNENATEDKKTAKFKEIRRTVMDSLKQKYLK
jgi:hypothetical protein